MFGTLFTTGYWAFQGVVLFWCVVLEKDTDVIVKREWLIHCSIWLIAMVMSFISLGLDLFEQSAFFPYPFLSTNWARWGLFMSILLFYFFVTVPPIFISLGYIIYVSFKAGSKFKDTYKFQLNILLFGLGWTVVLVSLIVTNAYFQIHGQDVADCFANWHACVILGGGNSCKCEFMLDSNVYWFGIIAPALIPGLLFLIFGLLTESNRLLWIVAVSNLINGDPFYTDMHDAQKIMSRGTTRQSNRSSNRSISPMPTI
jgi:hypothetical protein